jgi:thiosulfate/3-mercaptopyruvate sulfurtransferase
MPHTTLIATDALAALLDGATTTDQAALVIVDCRYDLTNGHWGLEQYRLAHIPGAVYASLSHDLAGERRGDNGRHPLPSVEAMAATFGRLGIAAGTQVIAYDQDSGMYASRLWWMLRYLGHDAVAVLEGGWAKWTREGRPARSGDESRAAVSFVPHPRESLRADLAEVQRSVRDESALLVDARAPERFVGASEPIDRVAGHIPGARNHSYKDNLTSEGTLVAPERLKAQFERVLDGRPPDQVVMYCGSGVTACHNLLAMEHVGMSGAKLYPGSWSEWSSDPQRPVETGPPRH